MYALSLAKDGRILHATLSKYAPSGATLVASLPDGDITDYLYINGEYIYDPLPKPEPTEPDGDADLLAQLQSALDILLTGGTEE